MSWIDKTLEVVAPMTALKRAQARSAMKVITEFERKYDAASYGRRTANWQAPATSQNRELEYQLRTLRNRSRDLARNNDHAKRAIQVIKNNVVGSGIRPAPWEDGRVEKRVKKLWASWGEKKVCDFDEQLNFYGLQGLIMRTVVESGECLIVRRRGKNKSGIPIQLQVLEPDYLDSYKNSFQIVPGQPFDFMGISFDENGKRKGYWLYDNHPSEGFNYKSRFVPASDVIHVYLKERPGQARGIPWGVQSFITIRDLGEYQDAQLVRQKIAACFSVFVTSPTGHSVLNPSKKDGRLEKVEPGIVEYLAPGEQVTMASPPGAEGYKEYTSTVLHKIAAGYGITYEALTGDYSMVNFSSGRMGWIEMHRNIQEWQDHMMVTQLCDDVWSWFIEAAQIAGLVGRDVPAKWTPPRREMLDPVKEVKGMSEEVRNGFKSWSEQVRANGYDPDEVIDEMKSDKDKLEAAGVTLPWITQEAPPEPGTVNLE